MKHHASSIRTGSLITATLLLVACGGKKSETGTLANTGNGRVMAGAGPLASGSYACEFVVEGGALGPHHCEIEGAHLSKLSGMEPFSGELAQDGATVKITAEIGCTDLTVKCQAPFTVELQATDTAGVWRGPVHGEAGWWLDGAQFEIGPDRSLGGAGYGGGDAYNGNE